MADGFGVFKGPTAGGDLAGFVSDQAVLATIGAGLVHTELGSLLGRGGLQRASHQAAQGGDSDLLQRGEIDVQARPLVPEGLAANNFAPLVRKVVDRLQILRGELLLRHRLPFLEVTSKVSDGLPVAMLGKALGRANSVLHPVP